MAATGERPERRATTIGIAKERYADWLGVRRVVSGAIDSYRTECVVDFNGGWAELRRFTWSEPIESIWQTGERCYFLSLSLDCNAETDRRNMQLSLAMPDGGARVLLVPPEQTISSICRTGGQRRSMRCLIDADFVESICARKPTREERAQIGAEDFSGGAIEWLLLRMYREISNAETGMDIAVESIARQISVEIARAIERRRHDMRRRSGGLPSWRMRLIRDRIHADGALPSVGELAIISGMTARHLGRAFLAETGGTIGKFIAAVMVERASKMLEAGVPVGVAAAMLGYGSSSSFAHAFRRETGVLPSTVRDGERRHGTKATGATGSTVQPDPVSKGRKIGH